jgi:phage-related protein
MKPIVWIGSNKKDLLSFPEDAIRNVGHALWLAQEGDLPPCAKPLRGFGGASVLEIIENNDGETYRAVYTVRFSDAVYVLHCFQKKSKSGIATPKVDVELIKSRLKTAEDESKKWNAKKKT